MKYLNDYTNEGITKALDKAGAFFAFSESQFKEQKVDGVVYVSGFGGMLCPKDTYKTLLDNLSQITDDGIASDIAENGIDGIIRRELSNHEAYYTGDIESTIDALSCYSITPEDVRKVFNDEKNEVPLQRQSETNHI